MLIQAVLIGLVMAQAAPPDSAILELQNRTIIIFRAPLGAATVDERLASAAYRIREAATSGSVEVTTRPVREGVLVVVGKTPVFTVTPAEADTAVGITVDARADATAEQLRQALEERRESHNLTALGTGLILALVATALFSLFIVGMIRVRRRLLNWISYAAAGAVPRLAIRGFTLLRDDHLIRVGRFLVTAVAWFLGIATSYGYVTFVLTRFPWTRPWGEALGAYLVATLRRLGTDALHSIPNLITVALILVVVRLVARIVKALFAAAEERRVVLPGVHPETAPPTRRIVTAFLWLLALVVAYPYLPGSNSAAFKGVSVFAGLLITLGSTGLVGQAMSGLVLMYSRSYRVGDFVKINEHMGTIVSLGMLSTRIRTTKNEYISLPNAVVVGGSITNYSFGTDESRKLILYSSVTIGYDVPWRQVHELLIDAASRTEGVTSDPAPWVLQRALNDWHVEYEINAAVDPAAAEEIPSIYSRLHANIQDAFKRAGVEIMSPSYFALRDGNAAAIPEYQSPKGSRRAFRVETAPPREVAAESPPPQDRADR